MKYTIWRVISFATKNFARNVGISMVTVTILSIALLSVNTLFLLRNATNAGLKAIENNVSVRLQFHYDAPQKSVDKVVATVKDLNYVTDATLLTADQVKEEFRARHASEKEIVAALDALSSNPFGAALLIKAQKADDYSKVLETISVPEFNEIIEQKTFGDHEAYISKISALSKRVTTIATVISILFVCFSIFIIFNAIRVTVYSQREEIGIMRLVGATTWFIRAPFYVEGLYYTFISMVAALALTYFMVQVADPFITSSIGPNVFSLQTEFIAQLPKLVIAEFVGIGLLTIVASTFAMRRYLKI